MSVHYNGRYNSIADIKGPSGWYAINTSLGLVHTYINQEYDGGGWALVLANRQGTGGMSNLSFYDATSTCNFRSSPGVPIPAGQKLGALSSYNVWIGTQYWPLLSGRVTAGKMTIVQYVATTSGTPLNGSHTKRYRWRADGFSSAYGFTGATALSDETATGAPGMYSYHAANGFGLTTSDFDQDPYGTNCSTMYNNNPFWYGACWDGNWFAGGGYADAPFWSGSGSDYHQYGAIYIK